MPVRRGVSRACSVQIQYRASSRDVFFGHCVRSSGFAYRRVLNRHGPRFVGWGRGRFVGRLAIARVGLGFIWSVRVFGHARIGAQTIRNHEEHEEEDSTFVRASCFVSALGDVAMVSSWPCGHGSEHRIVLRHFVERGEEDRQLQVDQIDVRDTEDDVAVQDRTPFRTLSSTSSSDDHPRLVRSSGIREEPVRRTSRGLLRRDITC